MGRRIVAGLVPIGLAVLLLILGIVYAGRHGFSARAEPSRMEAVAARYIRGLMVPRTVREVKNPVQSDPQVIRDAMAHFADHCSTCHANDGSGDTAIGRGLYPRVPDMRLIQTQSLTDGELFYIIEEGIRFTGMPGWSTGTPEGLRESWAVVHFIRRLPRLTPDELEEMSRLNPKTADERRQEDDIRKYLNEPTADSGRAATPAPVRRRPQ
jgi:mono/diheme cytochrome c family protein